MRPTRLLARTLLTKWVLLALVVVAALVWLAVLVTPAGGTLSVSVVDVGQGESILITTPAGQHVLIDGGPGPGDVCLALGEAMPFWERSIELVVLTHPHADHVSGLVEVLRRYEVSQVLYPQDIGYESEVYLEWLGVVEGMEVESVGAQVGQRVDLGGGALLEVLQPSPELLEGTESDVDNNAVVMRLEMEDVSFLLTSDLFADGERYLVEQGLELESTVLKVCHHGAGTSSSARFLAAVDPEVVVISVGADNPFGHPDEEVLSRLVDSVGKEGVYLTSEDGTVTFTTDGKRLWVETER
ncbi:MAG: ComEC/Rec2 family competence protein [Chloroflexota bacterium]